MINLASTSPPEYIIVGGTHYPCNYDFRMWVEVSVLLQELDTVDIDCESNIELVAQISSIVFGRVVSEHFGSILIAVMEFFRGYPKEDNSYSNHEQDDGTRLYSFKHDLNYIIIAIRNQSGIDLSYRRTEPFHWWEFMLEFQSLTDEHYISKVMGYRAYKGDNNEYLKLKQRYALPVELTNSDRVLAKKLDDIFYNA